MSDLAAWPTALPTPLIGRRHTIDPRSTRTLMESQRVRIRRDQEDGLEVIEAQWNFTADQFDTFKEFFEETLAQGSLPFEMVTFDAAEDLELLLQYTRELEFHESNYSFSRSDNLFSVVAVLEIVDEEVEEIESPYFLPEELQVNYDTDDGDETTCRHTIILSFPAAAGQDYILQISDSQDTGWCDHVYISASESGTQRVYLNNDYNGENWFRVINLATGRTVRRSVKPLASEIAPPIVNLTNVETAIVARPLWRDGSFTYPYSVLENAWISQTSLYMVPRARFEHVMDNGFSWDGTPTLISIDGESDALHVWTRDGSDPEIDTPMPKLDAIDDNIGAYRADFGLIIKACSFKDGCRSPYTVYLVDKRINHRPSFVSSGSFNSGSGYCDLVKTVDGQDYESAHSCNINWGGPGAFSLHIADTAGASPSGTHTAPNNGKVVYARGLSESESFWMGWPVHQAGASIFINHTVDVAVGAGYDYFPPCWTFFYINLWGLSEEPVTATMYLNTTGDRDHIPGTSQQPTNAARFIEDNIPIGSFTSWTIGVFEYISTLHHDFTFPDEDGYVPPTPVIPVEPYIPSVTIYDDNFETYAEGDATAMTLADGTGWNAAWVITAYPITTGEDDFESYSDGAIIDTVDADSILDPVYEGGGGWDDAWVFSSSALATVYGDDFEAYADGEVDSLTLGDGEGWSEVEFDREWAFFDYTPGGDDFESYSDGAVVTDDLENGVGWAVESWHIT